jgi:hypothetical protein
MIGGFILGIAATCILWLAFPYGLLAPDSDGYRQIGEHLFNPVSPLADFSRTPALPIAMRIAEFLPRPNAWILWMNGTFFALMLAITAWTGTLLFGTAKRGILFACVLLIIQFFVPVPWFYDAFALTDGTAASLLCGGILCAWNAYQTKSRKAWMIAYAMLGLSEVFRSMTITPVIGSMIALSMLLPYFGKWISWKAILVSILLITGPIALWDTRNILVYQRWEPNPFATQHLLRHAQNLWDDDDVIFDDPKVNAAFHQAIKTNEPVPPYNGPNILSIETAPWKGIVPLAVSQTAVFKEHGAECATTYAEECILQTSRVFSAMAKHTFALHPAGYVSQVFEKYRALFNQLEISFPVTFLQPDSRTSYVRMQKILNPVLIQKMFKNDRPWELPPISRWTATALYNIAFVFQYSEYMYGNQIMFYVMHACFAISILLCFFKKQKRVGQLMILLFGSAALSYFTIGAVTYVNDPRFASPGILQLDIILILTVISITSIIMNAVHEWKKALGSAQ